MFSDKLQNPFLKPSPFSNPSYTPSYSPASALPPRYNPYTPYEEPKFSISSASNQYTYEPRINSYSSKSFESKDIDSILSSNPFNREYQPAFSYLRTSSRDLSPAKLINDVPSRPSNYDNY